MKKILFTIFFIIAPTMASERDISAPFTEYVIDSGQIKSIDFTNQGNLLLLIETNDEYLLKTHNFKINEIKKINTINKTEGNYNFTGMCIVDKNLYILNVNEQTKNKVYEIYKFSSEGLKKLASFDGHFYGMHCSKTSLFYTKKVEMKLLVFMFDNEHSTQIYNEHCELVGVASKEEIYCFYAGDENPWGIEQVDTISGDREYIVDIDSYGATGDAVSTVFPDAKVYVDLISIIKDGREVGVKLLVADIKKGKVIFETPITEKNRIYTKFSYFKDDNLLVFTKKNKYFSIDLSNKK